MTNTGAEDRGFRKIVPLARVQLLTDALFALSMMLILTQIDYPDPETVHYLWLDALIEPITTATAIGLSLWSVNAGQAALLVIPLAFGAQLWRSRRRAKQGITS